MKKLFVAIYGLTILDAISTIIGVQLGVVEEANPFVQAAMTNQPILTGLVVCLLIGAVLYGVYGVRHRIRWLAYAMGGVLAVKVVIMGLHIGWITQVLRAL
jgi:dolichol kinase